MRSGTRLGPGALPDGIFAARVFISAIVISGKVWFPNCWGEFPNSCLGKKPSTIDSILPGRVISGIFFLLTSFFVTSL